MKKLIVLLYISFILFLNPDYLKANLDEEGQINFNDLPDEIIGNIFKFLDSNTLMNCEKISKKMSKISCSADSHDIDLSIEIEKDKWMRIDSIGKKPSILYDLIQENKRILPKWAGKITFTIVLEGTNFEFVLVPVLDSRPDKVIRPFLLLTTPLTQEQWITVMGTNPSYFVDRRKPVDRVHCFMADKFLATINQMLSKMGLKARLPTKPEYRYVASEGKATKYPWGDDESLLGEFAWYSVNSDKQTHPVKLKKPNIFGVYDIIGNVFEMVSDKNGRASGWHGGSWHCLARNVHSNAQFFGGLGGEYFAAGFRIIVDFHETEIK